MGRLLGIGCAPAKRAPLVPATTGRISVASGLEGDVRGSTPGRQITVLFRESWEAACGDVGVKLPWLTRRANLLVEGLETPQSGRLCVGEVVLEVTSETKPCRVMEAAQRGLRAAMELDWRGGVCCRVVHGGTISVGDVVELLGPVSEPPDTGK
jgi:MOSC domain-containing protein YiiM